MTSVDWVLHDGTNHIVYFGEDSYTEFACGKDTEGKLLSADPLLPKCQQCLQWLSKQDKKEGGKQ